jgi:hypothetical protein
MVNFNFNLTSMAVILWSGMLIISGSIWVLASQVRKLADLYEDRADAGAATVRPPAPRRDSTAASRARVTRRSTSATAHRSSRPAPESPYARALDRQA